MANGRSGGFGLSKKEFERILNSLSPELVVGSYISPSGSARVDVSTVIRMVGECPDDPIAIEEQDYKYYVVHIDGMATTVPIPEKWILVVSESPLFQEFREQHTRQGWRL